VSISIGSVQRINCPVSSAYQGPAFKLQFACCFCHALSCIVARPNLFAEQIGRRMQAKSDWTKKEKLPKAKKEKQRLWEARLNKLKPFQPEAIPGQTWVCSGKCLSCAGNCCQKTPLAKLFRIDGFI
jgi:hypothetical protein